VTGGTDSGTRSGVPRRHVPSTGPFMPPTLGRRHARSESSARDSDCPSLRWLARPRAARAIRVLVRGRPLSSASFTLRIPSLLAITPRVYDGRRRQAHLARGRIRKIKGLLALPWLPLSSALGAGKAVQARGGERRRDALGDSRVGKSRPHRKTHAQPYAPPRHGTHRAHETPCAGVSLGDPITCGLASTGRRNGGWVCSALQMAEDFANHRALRDDGDEPQCPALAQWTRAHL